MSKPAVKMNTFLKAGIVLGVVMAGVAALGVSILIENSLKTVWVPVANPSSPDGIIRKGDLILAEDIVTMEVGSYGFPGNIVLDPNVVKDKYATRDLVKGEYFYNHTLSTNYQKSLSEKVRYGAVAVPIDLITSVNADIQEDDFVMVKIIMGAEETEVGAPSQDFSNVDIGGRLPDSGVTIIDDELLAAVRVVGFYEGGGSDITKKKRFNREKVGNQVKDESLNPRMIVFDANPIQQALLLQGAYGGKIQLIILPEEEQIKHKTNWGLMDTAGNVVSDPIFEDDNKFYKDQAEQMKNDASNTVIDQDLLDERIREAAIAHLPDCPDPLTCKNPIHFNHVCPEGQTTCDDPIHHLTECEDENCNDPIHAEYVREG